MTVNKYCKKYLTILYSIKVIQNIKIHNLKSNLQLDTIKYAVGGVDFDRYKKIYGFKK